MAKDIFDREELLLGSDVMSAIASKKVLIFGVGGVGSWCAESLVRSGIEHLTLVDADRVCLSNVNRQLMATTKTIGRVKVDALKERLLDINPDAHIEAVQAIYSAETADSFHLSSYDYIIDAIDSLKDKAHLILNATATDARFFSSMGAALKMDPTKVCVAEFWKVKGCPLAAALRRKFRHGKTSPSKKFKCVYSEELLQNQGEKFVLDSPSLPPSPAAAPSSSTSLADGWSPVKAQINGTVSHITAIFGFTMAGLVIQDICLTAHRG